MSKPGVVITVACVVALAAGCGGHPAARQTPPPLPAAPTTAARPTTVAPAPTSSPPRVFPSYAAVAVGGHVPVFDHPGGHAQLTLDNPGLLGSPLTFAVVDRQDGWLHVRLPVRPNGRTGWIRSTDVRLRGVAYRLDLHRGAHRLDLYLWGEKMRSFTVALGRSDAPTPGGTYYLDALVAVDPPDGAYGPWAFGINAFPPHIEIFNGQPAVIGLHGTNRPDLLGQDVSHGCIRLSDADITYLAKRLPLGTPLRVLA